MTTLVWIFFIMAVTISAFISAKITSWNVKRLRNKELLKKVTPKDDSKSPGTK